MTHEQLENLAGRITKALKNKDYNLASSLSRWLTPEEKIAIQEIQKRNFEEFRKSNPPSYFR